MLTKTDLADELRVARLVAELRRLNPDAPLLHAADRDIDVGMLIGQETAGGEAIPARVRTQFRADDPTEDGDRQHATRVRSFALTFDQPLDWTAFGIWLTMLLNRHGDKVLRVKGILNLAGEAAPVAVHGVQHLVHTPVHMAAWPDADHRSRLVFIVEDLDPALIKRSLAAFNRLAVPAVARL